MLGSKKIRSLFGLSNQDNSTRSEDLYDVATEINKHIRKEVANSAYMRTIGRVTCRIKTSTPLIVDDPDRQQCWLVVGATQHAFQGDGRVVSRDTRMGEVLTKFCSGTHSFSTPTAPLGKPNEVEVTVYNRATYTPFLSTAQELFINLQDDGHTYSFQNLSDILYHHQEKEDKLKKQQAKQEEARRKVEEARLALEKARKEEEERLREEARLREEEEKKLAAEAEKMERELEESRNKIQQTKSFIRNDVSLRSQHILDPTQEDAKRSHFYDGVPIVIEGGPGTGKTTTMIQRLKFMISKEALDDYDVPLSREQIDSLTDPNVRDWKWLFFSPTDKLLMYLQNNMRAEYLNANENNTTTLDTFRSHILLDYKLRRPNSDGPFKLYKVKGDKEKKLILKPKKAIDDFESFCISNISHIMLNAFQLKTSDFSWNKLAQTIKAYCKRAESIKDIDALIRLFNSLYDNEKKNVLQIEQQLASELKKKALVIKNNILQDETLKSSIIELFEKWRQETIVVQEEEVEENAMDEAEDEEEELIDNIDYDAKLYQQLKPILKKLSLKKYDSNKKLTKRQKELYSLIETQIEIDDLAVIGELSWFDLNYAFLCRGVESNLLNQIPRLYKLYRKKLIETESPSYDINLLKQIQKKDGGKRIHPEELELIVGFINNMLLGMYKKSRVRFNGMKNKYVDAYKDNVKPVIGIDEATDYSIIDYYFMASFRHYEFSSITLCGDIMQGLNDNGIKSWDQLKEFILPNLEVFELKTSYRQLPSLLDMSKQMYKDERGVEAPYTTKKERSESEPAPICFISDDEEEKAEWIAKRIIEVYRAYNESMPSVAIFVGDDVNIKELVERINDQDYLNGVQVYDCSENRTAPSTKAVRVFRLTEVKGMEFEVVFFYDIDTALEGCSTDLMRRYLYVGISRATTHLAATFEEEDGNEDIIKYFDKTKDDWKI